MALSTWWSTDPMPDKKPLSGFEAGPADDFQSLAHLNRLPMHEVQERLQAGHRPYIATIDGQPASYGWVATRQASIGELDLSFVLPDAQRYLWDFGTLPSFRGLGLYPRLLQTILTKEVHTADFFWIIHAPENLPSGVGIEKAGFIPVGQLSYQLNGCPGLQPFDDIERAKAGAVLLGIDLIEAVLAPCWCCGSLTRHHCGVEDAEACWPPLHPDRVSVCSCAMPVRSRKTLSNTHLLEQS